MIDRRQVLAMGGALAVSPVIARAASIDARVRTGTIADVEHVVILMQENRSFDHYFGTMSGVRGFADRFPIPLPGGETVWTQTAADGRKITPFPLDTTRAFELMRVEGTPHNWADAQAAWDHGRMGRWPAAKTDRTMAHYRAQDLPFQFALADAFTICDAYHCSVQAGTNTNRLFLWTGTNDPLAKGGGPAISNSHDTFPEKGGAKDPYTWTTYVERLQAAGVSWRHYQDMDDLFSDNPLVGFRAFREAHAATPGSNPVLAERALTTRSLDALRADVVAGKLPQISFIISTAAESEHPGPSSPAQGADFTARTIEALTADPAVWARTVLLVMFDENDGFFDHMPPPAPPSRLEGGALAGASTVDTTGEYHMQRAASEARADPPELMGRPYGLGPRAPMYVISPWSRGGWVNSEVFDHTSIIRFLEKRFGVMEPNISPWRRSVCGDLTSAFDFKRPNQRPSSPLPATRASAERAKALTKRTAPVTPPQVAAPVQTMGARPSRALPYDLDVSVTATKEWIGLRFTNRSRTAGAVFHVYDRANLEMPPRRYTVGAKQSTEGRWSGSADLWVLGPNGFHRQIRGAGDDVRLTLSRARMQAKIAGTDTIVVNPAGSIDLTATGGWYDITATSTQDPNFIRRFAGRLETGRDSITDPAMGGEAIMRWS